MDSSFGEIKSWDKDAFKVFLEKKYLRTKAEDSAK